MAMITARFARVAALAMITATAACAARAPTTVRWPDVTLTATSGEVASYPHDLAEAPYTVFVFFAASCPCFGIHEARLRSLVDTFGPHGVRFVFVDSESGRTLADDARVAHERGLPGPIALDPGAKLASALGAVYATYSVVVDASGAIRYRGGIDSDKSHLRDDRTNYLADALADLVAGRAPRRAEAKTLGCVLQTW